MVCLQILKASGAGNTFLIVDLTTKPKVHAWSKTFGKSSRKSIAKKLCNSKSPLSADGFLLLENDRSADIRWDFYNADGSKAEMCGNAARCVALYLSQVRRGRNFSIRTGAGVVRAAVHSPMKIDVTMPSIRSYKQIIALLRNRNMIKFDFVHSGVPHAVVRVPSLKNVDKLADIVDNIRRMKVFTKTGTNVTFYKNSGVNKIDSLTFERGVSGFTQACGTGAVAAAYSWWMQNNKRSKKFKIPKVTVNVPGGKLTVLPDKKYPHLIGPAKIIAVVGFTKNSKTDRKGRAS